MPEMKQYTKNMFVAGFVIFFFVVAVTGNGIVNRDPSMFVVLGFFLAVIILAYALNGDGRYFRKLMKHLPADYKLVSAEHPVAAVDRGNFRLIYRIVSIPGSRRSYLSVEMCIPFPLEPDGSGECSEAGPLRRDLKDLLDRLSEEGILTDFNPLVGNGEEDGSGGDDGPEWIGQPMCLIFPLKTMTPSRLVALQDRLLGIVDKFGLQEYSWCIIRGGIYETMYYCHKGNLVQNTVSAADTYDRVRSDYKEIARIRTDEYHRVFSVEKYRELYDLASRSLGKDGLRIGDIEKTVRRMFKEMRDWKVAVSWFSGGCSVLVTNSKQKIGNTFVLEQADGRWWVHARGRMADIDPISTDDEASACDLFLRTIDIISR